MLSFLVRHLNSPLFQRRYLFKGLDDSNIVVDPQAQQGTDVNIFKEHSANGADTLENKNGTVEGPLDDQAQPENVLNEQNLEKDKVDGGTESELPLEDIDDDESQDSEDRHITSWADNQEGDIDEEDINDWEINYSLRFEIKCWYVHVREAERHWTLEERKNSKQWAILRAEFDKFFIKDLKAFNAWKVLHYHYDGRYWEPIHVGAYYGLTSLTDRLLSQGVDVQTITSTGDTPLNLAAESDDPPDILKLLLAYKADPNFQTEDRMPALFYWISFHAEPEYECVKELLRSGASCSSTFLDDEFNILHYFAFFGSDPKVLDLLLDNEEDPSNRTSINVQDKKGQTPLHKLMSRTSIPLELLEAFLKRGADVNAEDKASERPFYEAATWGETNAIKAIVDSLSDIDDDNTWGRTALHAAAWQGHKEIVEVLLSHKASPNRTDRHNRTPLFAACLCSTAQSASSEATAQVLMDQLLHDGFEIEEINMPTKRGRTPLREAAAHGFVKIVQTILDKIDPKDKDTINKADIIKGRTALHCAAFRGRAEMVKLLLQHGADATLRDGKDTTGKTALQLCHEQWAILGSTQYEAALSTLIDYDSIAAAQNKDLLTVAAINGSTLILEKLLDAKADLNEPDQYGWTPLLLARQFQRTEAVDFLSRRVAQIGIKPTKWIYSHKIPWTQVSEDGRSLKHRSGRRLCVLADHPIPAWLSKYYYEIEISKGPKGNGNGDGDGDEEVEAPSHPILAIGFCTSTAQLLEFPGWPNKNAPSSHSWAYHGDGGGFFSSFKNRKAGESRSYGPGDTVGCGVDYEKGIVFFTRDGEKIEKPYFDNVRGRLFPVLGLDESVAVEANFGNDVQNKPFKWSDEAGTGVNGKVAR